MNKVHSRSNAKFNFVNVIGVLIILMVPMIFAVDNPEDIAKNDPNQLTPEQFDSIVNSNPTLALEALNTLSKDGPIDKVASFAKQFYHFNADLAVITGTKFSKNAIQSPKGENGKRSTLDPKGLASIAKVEIVNGGFVLTPIDGPKMTVYAETQIKAENNKLVFQTEEGDIPLLITGKESVIRQKGDIINLEGAALVDSTHIEGSASLILAHGKVQEMITNPGKNPTSVSIGETKIASNEGNVHVFLTQEAFETKNGINKILIDSKTGNFDAVVGERNNKKLTGVFVISQGEKEYVYHNGKVKLPGKDFQSVLSDAEFFADINQRIRQGKYLTGGTQKYFLPETIEKLQEILLRENSDLVKSGLYVSGKFDQATWNAIAGVQRQIGVEPDGTIGPLTLRKLQDKISFLEKSDSKNTFQRSDDLIKIGNTRVERTKNGKILGSVELRPGKLAAVTGSYQFSQMKYAGIPMADIVATWTSSYKPDPQFSTRVEMIVANMQKNFQSDPETLNYVKNSVQEGLRSAVPFAVVTRDDKPHTWIFAPDGSEILDSHVAVGRIGNKVATGDHKTPAGVYPFEFGYGTKVPQGYFNKNFPGIAFHPPMGNAGTEGRCSQTLGCVRLPRTDYTTLKQTIGTKEGVSGFNAFIAPESPTYLASLSQKRKKRFA